MNKKERRKAASIKRKVRGLSRAARELAIQPGVELHDAPAEKHEQDFRSIFEAKRDELYKQASEEQANRFAERLAKGDRKAREYLSDLVRWRRAYLATYLASFATDGSPEPQGRLTSMEAVETAADEFKDRLAINGVEKNVGHFDSPELLYGALRWLATTYRDAKTRARSCPDLDKSCRNASGFRYIAHQSEVTMGQYPSDYELTWGDKVVKLREHVRLGSIRNPRHTIRVAFFFDVKTKMVVVGYVGLHQQTRAT